MEQKFFFFDIDNTLAVWPEGKIPDIALNKVDFPAPFPPIIVIKSPLLITRFIFFKA